MADAGHTNLVTRPGSGHVGATREQHFDIFRSVARLSTSKILEVSRDVETREQCGEAQCARAPRTLEDSSVRRPSGGRGRAGGGHPGPRRPSCFDAQPSPQALVDRGCSLDAQRRSVSHLRGRVSGPSCADGLPLGGLLPAREARRVLLNRPFLGVPLPSFPKCWPLSLAERVKENEPQPASTARSER